MKIKQNIIEFAKRFEEYTVKVYIRKRKKRGPFSMCNCAYGTLGPLELGREGETVVTWRNFLGFFLLKLASCMYVLISISLFTFHYYSLFTLKKKHADLCFVILLLFILFFFFLEEKIKRWGCSRLTLSKRLQSPKKMMIISAFACVKKKKEDAWAWLDRKLGNISHRNGANISTVHFFFFWLIQSFFFNFFWIRILENKFFFLIWFFFSLNEKKTLDYICATLFFRIDKNN